MAQKLTNKLGLGGRFELQKSEKIDSSLVFRSVGSRIQFFWRLKGHNEQLRLATDPQFCWVTDR